MTVKDKITGKILDTNSVWLKKEWLNNPKRYLTNFKIKETKVEITKEVEGDK